MKDISFLSTRIKPSLTIDLFNRACQYKDVIDSTLGNPDIRPHQCVKQAAFEAIPAGKTRFSQNSGLLELRKVISHMFIKEYGIEYNPKTEILESVGGMEGLYLFLLSILDVGDEGIVSAPYWLNYVQMVQMCGAKPIVVTPESEMDLSISIDSIKRVIPSKKKNIIINPPCNPSGILFFRAEIS